jgi:phage gpG-like protein
LLLAFQDTELSIRVDIKGPDFGFDFQLSGCCCRHGGGDWRAAAFAEGPYALIDDEVAGVISLSSKNTDEVSLLGGREELAGVHRAGGTAAGQAFLKSE